MGIVCLKGKQKYWYWSVLREIRDSQSNKGISFYLVYKFIYFFFKESLYVLKYLIYFEFFWQVIGIPINEWEVTRNEKVVRLCILQFGMVQSVVHIQLIDLKTRYSVCAEQVPRNSFLEYTKFKI